MSIKWWHIGLGVGAAFLLWPKSGSAAPSGVGPLTKDEYAKLIAATAAKIPTLTNFSIRVDATGLMEIMGQTIPEAGSNPVLLTTGLTGRSYGELNSAIANAK